MTLVDATSVGDVTGELPVVARLRAHRDSVAVRGWLAATFVYVTAAFHRSALGVAGLDAVDRFGISTGALSAFVLVQLGVYAAMQIPTGVLVDRYGSRRLLLVASSLMATAQLLFAVAPTFSIALAARLLLGAGDALTFVSILRHVTNHFSAKRYTLIIGLTGVLGAVGIMAATVPLNAALGALGWTPTFGAASIASVVAFILVWLLVPGQDRMAPGARRPPGALRDVLDRVADNVTAAWSNSATRAGFWLHYSTMAFAVMFGVLWGVPYLIAQGYSRAEASATLTLSVVAGTLGSIGVGIVFSRFRAARVPFALFVSFATIAGWSWLVLGFNGTPPRGLIAFAVAATAIGGPASAIGFALARDYNPADLVGTASGIVNVGGFLSGILTSVVVGQVLNFVGAEDSDAFRIAFGLAVLVQAVGFFQALRWYRRLRAGVLAAQSRGETVPVPAVRHRWDVAH
jgi:MFS family permease